MIGKKQQTSWDEIPVVKQFEGSSFQAIHGKSATVAKFRLRKGLRTPPSKHFQEQFTYVIEGRLSYEVAGEEVMVEAGGILHVESNVVHRAEVLEDSIVLDFFAPSWPNLPDRGKGGGRRAR